MNLELENKLIKQFPTLFKDVYEDETKTNICWGCECGDGWFPIIYAACQAISAADKEAYFTQIKEKFGTLCMYLVGNDESLAVAHMAECMSMQMCEFCGSVNGVKTKGINGWIRTLCKECRERGDKKHAL